MNAVVERVANPFGNAPVVAEPSGASAMALAKREVAEIQASMMLARQFPRDPVRAMDRIINACSRPEMAEDATYVYSRGGAEVSGPSIRLAEVLAQNWGNIDIGVKELTRANGVSEVMAFACDLETGFRDSKVFQVRHWRDKKGGQGYSVTDERDIYEIVANVAARRKRACILAVIPSDVVDAAVKQCDVTLSTKIQVTPESIKAMLEYFEKFSVTKEMIEKRIQRHIDSILPAQMLSLKKVVQALKDGMGKPEDYFELPEADTTAAPSAGTAGLKEKLREKQAADKAADAKAEKPYEPKYTVESAIATLKKAGDEKTLDVLDAEIKADFKASGRELHVSIQATRDDRREALKKI